MSHWAKVRMSILSGVTSRTIVNRNKKYFLPKILPFLNKLGRFHFFQQNLKNWMLLLAHSTSIQIFEKKKNDNKHGTKKVLLLFWSFERSLYYFNHQLYLWNLDFELSIVLVSTLPWILSWWFWGCVTCLYFILPLIPLWNIEITLDGLA